MRAVSGDLYEIRHQRVLAKIDRLIAERNAAKAEVERLTAALDRVRALLPTDRLSREPRTVPAHALEVALDGQPEQTNKPQRLAECGQPWPCGHAPDGGNHPVGRP